MTLSLKDSTGFGNEPLKPIPVTYARHSVFTSHTSVLDGIRPPSLPPQCRSRGDTNKAAFSRASHTKLIKQRLPPIVAHPRCLNRKLPISSVYGDGPPELTSSRAFLVRSQQPLSPYPPTRYEVVIGETPGGLPAHGSVLLTASGRSHLPLRISFHRAPQRRSRSRWHGKISTRCPVCIESPRPADSAAFPAMRVLGRAPSPASPHVG